MSTASPPSPVRILLLAPPGARGAESLWEQAREAHEAGRPLEILLTGRGLAWKDAPDLAELSRSEGVHIGLCSRSAREHALEPASMPAWIRWTSLVAFCTALEPEAELWGLLP